MSVSSITTILTRSFGASSTAPTASPVTVDTTVDGTVLIAANTARKSVILQNCGSVACLIRFGGNPSAAAYNYSIAASGEIELLNYTGAIKGITASGSTSIAVTEFV